MWCIAAFDIHRRITDTAATITTCPMRPVGSAVVIGVYLKQNVLVNSTHPSCLSSWASLSIICMSIILHQPLSSPHESQTMVDAPTAVIARKIHARTHTHTHARTNNTLDAHTGLRDSDTRSHENGSQANAHSVRQTTDKKKSEKTHGLWVKK